MAILGCAAGDIAQSGFCVVGDAAARQIEGYRGWRGNLAMPGELVEQARERTVAVMSRDARPLHHLGGDDDRSW